MRLSKAEKDAKIVKLYQNGWSYRQLQKRYHRSPNYIAKLVQGIEVTCTSCSKPKSKVRFHAHHPDRLNRPDYTIPLCPSCHAKEEAKLRAERKEKPKPSLSAELPINEGVSINPATAPFFIRREPLSPKEKKVMIVGGAIVLVETLAPGFFGRRWQETKNHGKKKKPLMGLDTKPH